MATQKLSGRISTEEEMDTLFEWLPRIGAVLTMGIGAIGFFKPTMLLDSLGYELKKPIATSESRAVFGGLNLGAALAALYFDDPTVYTTLGVAWTAATAARFVSMAADGTSLKDSIPPIIVDGVLALLFLSAMT
jgi:hypothetical protein